jgi:hypothetical protein
MSEVRADCRVSPLTRVSSSRSDASTSVSIHGPSGHEPSKPFARVHCAERHVVRARVAEDGTLGLVEVDPPRQAADHDRELSLVVDTVADRQQLDRISRPEDRGRGLEEQQRLIRHLAAELRGVRRVVLSDADRLGRQHRREHSDVGERYLLAGEHRVLEERAAERADRLALEDARGDPVAEPVADQPHVRGVSRSRR